MRPLKLEIENFGPFVGKTVIDFDLLDEIFLIAGKTGSGKTTIFDAICFALYGKAPGSREALLTEVLRSDYAAEYQECRVSLEFSLGEKKYRVDRSPRQERLKKKGIGATTVEETAEFYELVSGGSLEGGLGWKSLASRKSEADQQIQRRIGLSMDEFFKIVLLPQGKFAEFLQQSTSDRRKVLGKLFPVDFAARIQELASGRTKDALSQAREAERSLKELSSRVSFDTLPEQRRRAEETLKKAKDDAAALEQEGNRLERILDLEKNRANVELRMDEAGREAAALNLEAPAVGEKEKRLALSRQAQPLARHLFVEREKKTALEAATTAVATAREEFALAEKAFEKADLLAGTIPAMEEELNGYREKRPGLLEIAGEEETLRRNLKELEDLGTAMTACRGKIGALKKALEDKDALIAGRKALADQASAITEVLDKERGVKDLLVKLRETAADTEELDSRAETAEAKLSRLETEKTELQRRVPVLQDELLLKEAEKTAHEQADLAAHLSEGLKPGEPCPVCGSREHPLPAAARLPAFGIEERIEALKASLKDAERKLTERLTELESVNLELARVRQQGDKLRDKITGLTGGFEGILDPTLRAEQFGKQLEAKSRELTALAARQKEARQAADSMIGLYREQGELKNKQIELGNEEAGLREKYRGLEKADADLRLKHQVILREWSLNGKEGPAGEPAAETLSAATEALEALDRAVENLDRRVRELREKRETAASAVAASRARAEGSAAALEEAERQSREAAAALREALAGSPFGDAAALESATLDSAGEAALDTAITRWKESRSRLKARTEELERDLAEIRAARSVLGTAPGSPAEIEAALKTLAGEREAAGAARDQASAELANLTQDEERLREAGKRHEELAQKAARLTALSDDLSGRGKNWTRKSFDIWLLGLYLREIAALATKRLERMSESRYSLVLNSEGESGRGLAGLDLAVFDANTGKTRPCSTLSGGESFMASISLALGLADSIQTRSGGVRLDAVFIDEGFGSLDEGTLDMAMGILDELREHRMVGLISHVGEMRSRIPSRIDVIKTRSGSKVEIAGH
jgi:exonuclease SbcC